MTLKSASNNNIHTEKSTCRPLARVQADKLQSRRSETLDSVRAARWPAVVGGGGRRGATEGSWTQIQVSRHRGRGRDSRREQVTGASRLKQPAASCSASSTSCTLEVSGKKTLTKEALFFLVPPRRLFFFLFLALDIEADAIPPRRENFIKSKQAARQELPINVTCLLRGRRPLAGWRRRWRLHKSRRSDLPFVSSTLNKFAAVKGEKGKK